MIENNIGISVIIPIYNVEEYLKDCLDSILEQSFEHYEIICIDDASTDNSLNILRQYERKYEKIHIIQHNKNKGLSVTRNSGLKMARGKYIFFLDSDDMIFGNTALEELYDLAEEVQTDIIYFDIVRKYGEKPLILENQKTNFSMKIYTGKELFCVCCEEKRLLVEACRQFYRREFLIDNNIEFYEGILHEDMLFSFLCAMKAKKVIEIEKIYYIYRQRENSIMGIHDRRRAQSVYLILSEIYLYWLTHNFTENENRAIAYYFNSLYRAYKKYQNFEYEYCALDYGNYAEKFVYQLLKNDSRPFFLLPQMKQIVNADNVILYGAGYVAENVIYYLRSLEINIKYLAVTDKKQNPRNLFGIEVKEISKLQEYNKNAVIVVAVTEQFVEEIVCYLKELGFSNIVTLNYS